jgi:hypothetical protein
VDNVDPITKGMMPKKWISVNRKMNKEYDPEIEFNDTIKIVD